jgi:hypothetical protein
MENSQNPKAMSNQKKLMTPLEALKFMEETGKPIKPVVGPDKDAIDIQGYYQLFQNEKLLKLMPATSCAARVMREVSLSYWKYCEKFDYLKFEEYEPPGFSIF